MSADPIVDYYNAGREHDRLERGVPIERERTRELILRHITPAPAVVHDIGGGSGPYAFWLAEQGYTVHLRDLMPLHIQQAQEQMPIRAPLASLAVGDALHIDLPDASAHAVLLLGPLYHLSERQDRVQALREAHRMLLPGGVMLAAGISRYASLLDGLNRGYIEDPTFGEIARADLATGQHRNPSGQHGYFTTAYMHRPEEMIAEAQDAGYHDVALYAIEGPLWLTRAAQDHWDDPEKRERYLAALRWIEQDMALMAASSHLMVVGHKPQE